MCGKWLAVLHSQALPAEHRYSPEELLEYIEVRLNLLVERSAFDKRLCDRVMAYLLRILPMVPLSDLERVKTHGDYAPYNIIVSGQELVVFDPAVGSYFGRLGNYCARYEDIVHFYNPLKESNLPAGSYDFHLEAYAAAYGPDRRLMSTTVPIHLLPPFHRTPGFFAMTAVLVLGVTVVAFRQQRIRKHRRLADLDRERGRIAREIHDTLEQTFVAVKYQLEFAADRVGEGHQARGSIKRAAELVERATDETKASIWALRTGMFGKTELSMAVSAAAGTLLRDTNIEFELKITGTPYRLAADREWQVGVKRPWVARLDPSLRVRNTVIRKFPTPARIRHFSSKPLTSLP